MASLGFGGGIAVFGGCDDWFLRIPIIAFTGALRGPPGPSIFLRVEMVAD